MNIQHLIRTGLQGEHPVPRYQSSDSIALGTNYYSERFEVPVRKCDFVVTTSLDNHKTQIFLSSFTIPAFGLDFSYAQGALITQAPSVSPVSISGYIPQNWQANISNFYYRQFKGGLLNADLPAMDVTINYVQFNEDSNTDIKQLVSSIGKGATKVARSIGDGVSKVVGNSAEVAQGILSKIGNLINSNIPTKVQSFDTWQNADGQYFSDGKLVFDSKMPSVPNVNDGFQSESEMDIEQSIVEGSPVLTPILTFTNAQFSVPAFQTDLSSNDLAQVSLHFSYTNVIQHSIKL